jgi:transposase-like protein
MEPTEIKQELVIAKCPYCRSERFTVDWSVRDVRSDPVSLRERYVCDDCGKRFAQEWLADGWKMTHSLSGELRSGRNYLEKCVECGCEELEVQHGGVCLSTFDEKYRCEKCGAEHVQGWRAVGWTEISDMPEANIKVLPHERALIEDDESAEEYGIDKPLLTGDLPTEELI